MGTRSGLGLAVAAAIALRFPTLGHQSFWRDEASSALELHGSFGHMWAAVRLNEGMPPGYFVLAWLWTRVFGLGEVGLRSLSAIAGVATVPVAWALARELKPRAANPAAFLVAVSPFLVWYSQEGRPYALLVLLTATATLFWVQDRPLAWGVAAAGALLVHYFAVFIVVPQAILLVRRGEWRALVAPVVAGAALLPLIVSQADNRVGWIDETSLGSRTVDIAKHFVAGEFGTPIDVLGFVALVALVAALVLGGQRRVIGLALIAIALPVALALVGPDYVLDRYVIAALVPLLAAAACGPRSLVIGFTVLSLIFTIESTVDAKLQRENWRGIARGLPTNAFVVTSPDGIRPLQWYKRGHIITGTVPITMPDVYAIDSWRFGRKRPATPAPPPGFGLADRRDGPAYVRVHYHAAPPVPVDPRALGNLTLQPGEVPVALLTR